MEESFLFLVHCFGANHFDDMKLLREAFEGMMGHCQAIHQGYYEDGTPFRIVMAKSKKEKGLIPFSFLFFISLL